MAANGGILSKADNLSFHSSFQCGIPVGQKQTLAHLGDGLISPGNCPYTGPDAAMMNLHSYIQISQSSPDPNLQSQSHTDDAVRSLPSGSSLPTCAVHSFLLHAAFSLHHLQLSASLLITNDRLHMLANRPPARVSF